jgi:tRNA-Thr(GGU) m(6)t(6)A37 methyltransferase TsaA
MTTITYKPIGIIHSPHTDPAGMPIQPAAAEGVAGTAEVYPEFCAGLRDLDGFSHIILLYHFHRSEGCALEVQPFMDDAPRGLFATRAPRRPNPIGLSVVRLVRVEGCTLHVENVDILDGTPLLDIKPYVPAFDSPDAERIGWLATRVSELRDMKADDRFA